MATVATLVAKLEADIRDFERGMDKAERSLKDVEGSTDAANRKTQGLTGSFGSIAGKAAVAGAAIAGVAMVGYDLVSSFSDLEESINAVNVQFGDGAQTILDFGETAAESVGLSNSAFNQLSVVTGATLSSFITDEQEAADATIKLTERAADMASVFNTDVDEALTALQSAIRGEMEPIRRFGVSLDDTSIRARAVEMGLAATTGEVTIQQKQMAALALIYEQTDKTAGDFANTSDSVANRQKVLGAQFEDVKASLGEALIPAFEALLDAVEKAIPLIEALAKAMGGLGEFFSGNVRSEMDRWKSVIEEVGEAMEDGATEAEAWAEVFAGEWKPAIADVVAGLGTAGRELIRNRDAMNLSARAADDWARAQAAAEAAAAAATTATVEEKEAIVELAQAQAAAADPVLNLIAANQRFEEAVANVAAVEADATSTTADLTAAQADLIASHGNLNVAQAGVAVSMGENIEAFKEAALAAGLTQDAADALAASLFGLPSEIDIAILASIDISGDIGALDDLISAGGGGSVTIGGGGGGTIIGFHEGGVVPGPIGAPMLAQVHGGEVITNPHNPAALQTDSGGVTVVFAGPTMGNQEIERAVRRAVTDNSRRTGRG